MFYHINLTHISAVQLSYTHMHADNFWPLQKKSYKIPHHEETRHNSGCKRIRITKFWCLVSSLESRVDIVQIVRGRWIDNRIYYFEKIEYYQSWKCFYAQANIFYLVQSIDFVLKEFMTNYKINSFCLGIIVCIWFMSMLISNFYHDISIIPDIEINLILCSYYFENAAYNQLFISNVIHRLMCFQDCL